MEYVSKMGEHQFSSSENFCLTTSKVTHKVKRHTKLTQVIPRNPSTTEALCNILQQVGLYGERLLTPHPNPKLEYIPYWLSETVYLILKMCNAVVILQPAQ